MRSSIWLAVPPRMSAHPFDPDRPMPPIERVEVMLVDPDPVLESVMRVIDNARLENIDIHGVMLGAVHYLTLQERMRELTTRAGARGGASFTIDGVLIFMDPLRDEGPPMPVYTEDMAVHVYATRRTNAAKGK